jgi:hypothetical protein
MMYLYPVLNENGAYPPPQSVPFIGAKELTDEQTRFLVECMGFVTITETGELVDNPEAREAWEATLPAESAIV